MRTVGVSDVVLDARTQRLPFLIELADLAGVKYRFSSFTTTASITFEGNAYAARAMERTQITQTRQGDLAVEVAIENLDGYITQLAYAGSFRNWGVRLIEVYLDEAFAVLGTDERVVGFARGVKMPFEGQSAWATLGITSELPTEMLDGPLQDYGNGNCPFLFKGEQCQYSGLETRCERTYARCEALGNQVRYGGHRFAPPPGSTFPFGGDAQPVVIPGRFSTRG